MSSNPFKDKRIAIIGLSVEGLSSIEYLREKGAAVTVCDQKNEKEFGKEILNTLSSKKINTCFGKNYLADLTKYDLLIITPGFPLWNKKLQRVVKSGIKVSSQTKIFFDLCPGRIIGVTGTKGKGTTSTLIYKLLKVEGKKVFLGGNIGTPPFSFLDKITPSSWVVLELSSFQLVDLQVSPHIAVVLNITSDHLYSASYESPNYHLSQEEYRSAKRNIVRFQKKSDFAVLNRDYNSSFELKDSTCADVWLYSLERELKKGSFIKDNNIYLSFNNKKHHICKVSEVRLKGRHNLENITAAVLAAYLAGAKISNMAQVIRSFKGLEHRLEFVKDKEGIKYYNDSFSTTPQTTIAAIRSFKEPIILICGGSEKGSDYSDLGKEIIRKENVKAVVLIGKTAPKIKKSIQNASRIFNKPSPPFLEGAKTMNEILKKARLYAKKGDIVLLSPACASFDMFKNYKERGLLFKLLL